MRLDRYKTREIVAKALMRSKSKNTRRDAEEPPPLPFPRRPSRDSLLLLATVEKPKSIDYDPAEATGIVGKDVELLECQGCEATTATLEGMLRHCVSFKAVPDLRRVHNHIVMTERCSRSLGLMLIEAYGKCSLPDAAVDVFRGLWRKNEEAWTVAIVAMADNGRHRDAFNLFRDMILDGSPPLPVTYTRVLKSCGEIDALREAKMVHLCAATSRWWCDVAVIDQLIETYGKVGAMEEVGRVFGSVAGGGFQSWKKMWDVYKSRGMSIEALKIFLPADPMQRSRNWKMFEVVVNACSSLDDARSLHSHVVSVGMDSEPGAAKRLLGLYIRLGSLKDAQRIFDASKTKNAEWWQMMIRAYSARGDLANVRRLYAAMKSQRLKFNKKTRSKIIQKCEKRKIPEMPKKIPDMPFAIAA